MTVKQLMEELKAYPEDTLVGFLVEYTEHDCRDDDNDYCYCPSSEHELMTVSLREEHERISRGGGKFETVKKLWIFGQ
jgi:hypothetical protein